MCSVKDSKMTPPPLTHTSQLSPCCAQCLPLQPNAELSDFRGDKRTAGEEGGQQAERGAGQHRSLLLKHQHFIMDDKEM